MTPSPREPPPVLGGGTGRAFHADGGEPLHLRLARSALCPDGLTSPEAVEAWLAEARDGDRMTVRPAPLSELPGWNVDPRTGDLTHVSGAFFTVHGLAVEHRDAPVPRREQPIIDQPEIGILGLLVRAFDGVPHCLVQTKAEPGNVGGVQIAPTVQATRSNYTRVHRGRPVPYLEHFRTPSRGRLLVDVRQSEHGAWFLRKRNRNMVVETREDIELLPGFRWLTLHRLHRLLDRDDLVNMDLRSVLGCLPVAGPGAAAALAPTGGFQDALARSLDASPGLHADADLLHWITERRTRTDVRVHRVPLSGMAGWRHDGTTVTPEDGRSFEVAGVTVGTAGREVDDWSQPVVRPLGTSVAAFLVKRIDGVLHLLAQALAEPGCSDVLELAPTVQCVPHDLDGGPPQVRPPFLDDVLAAGPDRVRFAATLSEEGGRLYHARGRYLIVEAAPGDGGPDEGPEESPDFRWLTLRQFAALLPHSHYVNVQARSLLACLYSLPGR
ncbi:NDP-hexose 2,3-dehydratase family protein [Actinomadura harenae]|uniref:NDP-hexose 2,3-dehydratase n=1 Tax=Actinomadura harenae TaxID=2483351 RepID=A0A3M2KZ54_9ACTN|nr:NDP-hexose 2,3-dehydratase family protein [Actinomadura harenae]RMI30769.1 NDP-hexose 2,3-dehydratase [Actinomadura harenae]